MRDLSHNVSIFQSLPAAARTATINGATIDTLGYGALAVAFMFGAYTDGTFVPKLQDSPDGATWTDVTDPTQLTEVAGNTGPTPQNGVFPLAPITGSAAANSVLKVGYIGWQRYVRPVLTISGTTSGAIVSVVALLGLPANAPV